MTQQIGKVTVTTSQKSVQSVSVDTVTIRGPGVSPDKTVQSIQYGIRSADLKLSALSDVVITSNTDNAVITYDSNSQIFTVQTLPEIDGGYF